MLCRHRWKGRRAPCIQPVVMDPGRGPKARGASSDGPAISRHWFATDGRLELMKLNERFKIPLAGTDEDLQGFDPPPLRKDCLLVLERMSCIHEHEAPA